MQTNTMRTTLLATPHTRVVKSEDSPNNESNGGVVEDMKNADVNRLIEKRGLNKAKLFAERRKEIMAWLRPMLGETA